METKRKRQTLYTISKLKYRVIYGERNPTSAFNVSPETNKYTTNPCGLAHCPFDQASVLPRAAQSSLLSFSDGSPRYRKIEPENLSKRKAGSKNSATHLTISSFPSIRNGKFDMGFGRNSKGSISRTPSSPPLTTSTSLTNTINGSHHFKINGYSLSKGMGVGKYIASDTFNVGGYSWAIYFYPDGKSPEDNSAYVSLFIALASEGTDVRALFELTLLDQSGNGRHKVHSHFGRTLESGPYTLKYRGSMWGYKRFFKRSLLEGSDYLKDDCLSVHCSVGVVRSHTEGPKFHVIPVPPSDIGQHLGQLLESGKGTDVSFIVDGETFAAHKLVLAARSPVFRAQLFGPMKDHNTNDIEVEDMQAPVFKALLHFMYWDSLPDMQELVGVESKCASTLMAQHLLAAADCYGIERLSMLCEVKLCEEVSINTVATTLALAEQHNCSQLKTVCLKFIAMPANLSAVMQTEGFEYLSKSCPSVVTELLQYVAKVSEHSIISSKHLNDSSLDGSDNNGRRVKQRT